MSTSDSEIKIQMAEVIGEIRNLTNSLNHYTAAQEKHREETEKRLDKTEERTDKRFDKIESKLSSHSSDISEIKERSAGEAAILDTIRKSNDANKRLAYSVVGSIIILAVLGGLAFRLGVAS